MPQGLGGQIFFWVAIGFIILYFVAMIVDLVSWLIKGRPISVNPVQSSSKPANDNATAVKTSP